MKKRLIAALLAAVMLAGCPPESTIPKSTSTETEVFTLPTEATVPKITDAQAPEETIPAVTIPAPSEPEMAITDVQQNALNMLNYLAFTAQEIYIAKDNRLVLEDIYTALLNEIRFSVRLLVRCFFLLELSPV